MLSAREGLQRPRARASTTKFSDLRFADRAVGHQIYHIQLAIELRELVFVVFFHVRRCEQVQNSEASGICTHESLKSFAGALFVLWVDNAGRVDGRQSSFVPCARQLSTANGPN